MLFDIRIFSDEIGIQLHTEYRVRLSGKASYCACYSNGYCIKLDQNKLIGIGKSCNSNCYVIFCTCRSEI